MLASSMWYIDLCEDVFFVHVIIDRLTDKATNSSQGHEA